MTSIRRFLRLAILAILASALVSCGDTQDKYIKDNLAWLQEVTEVLNKVADGSMSSADATEKIKDLGKEYDELLERRDALFKDVSEEEKTELNDKYKDELSKAAEGMMKAMMKIQSSGRATQELRDALMNMKD